MIVESGNAAFDGLVQSFRLKNVAPETAVCGDTHRRSKQKTKIGFARRLYDRIDKTHHRVVRNEKISPLDQLGVETSRSIGAGQGFLADLVAYEGGQAMEDMARNDRNRDYVLPQAFSVVSTRNTCSSSATQPAPTHGRIISYN